MQNPTLEEALNLIQKQQALIKHLVAFTNSTTETLTTISDTLEVLQDNITSLQMAQSNTRNTVTNFLAANEVDFRKTEGGTG